MQQTLIKLEQHNNPLQEALILTLSFKKSKEISDTPFKLSTQIKLDFDSDTLETSTNTIGFLTDTSL